MNIDTVPKITIVEIATATRSLLAFKIGSVANIAAAPQIELPAPINTDVSLSNLKYLIPKYTANTKVEISMNASMSIPLTPTSPISWNVSLKPYKIIPKRRTFCFEKLMPEPQ